MQQVKQQMQPANQNMNAIHILTVRFAEKLNATPFPIEKLSGLWIENAVRALNMASPAYLQIDVSQMKKIWDKCNTCTPSFSGLSLNEFAVLSNNLENRSCADLGIPMEIYLTLMEEAAEHVVYFNQTIAAMRKEVEEEVMAENLAAKANLSAVKAEA